MNNYVTILSKSEIPSFSSNSENIALNMENDDGESSLWVFGLSGESENSKSKSTVCNRIVNSEILVLEAWSDCIRVYGRGHHGCDYACVTYTCMSCRAHAAVVSFSCPDGSCVRHCAGRMHWRYRTEEKAGRMKKLYKKCFPIEFRHVSPLVQYNHNSMWFKIDYVNVTPCCVFHEWTWSVGSG
jgi:hypothetical protein